MMSSITSLTPSGTASARLQAGGGAGDPMASAFAMLFALMPGMGDAADTGSGEGAPKSDSDTAKDGCTTEKDGKDVPSDAAALPVMPFAIPTVPLTPPEPVASPVAASGASPAPITTLLAAMPTLPDAGSTPTTAPMATAPATATRPVVADSPIAFDPLKGTMPIPPAMTAAMTDDGVPELPVPNRTAPTLATAVPTGAAATPAPASPVMVAQQAATTAPAVARDTVAALQTSPAPDVTPPTNEPVVRATAPGIPLAIRGDALPTAIPIDAAPIAAANDGIRPPSTRQDTPLRFAVTNGFAPVAAPLPIQAPAPIIQAGQSAPAIQLFGTAMRSEQSFDPRTDRRKDETALSVDPATLTRADSLTAASVVATTGAEQAPLDMTQHHWPQGMIDRIDRMREDAATADTRIQLSPDALGGIAVNLRHEDGATHIHFTADQAQTASLLADAQPTLARLAEEKGMRLGQTAVDLGQSGMGGERQAPPRRPDPVMPTRPAFAGTTASSDAGDPAAASTRIA